MDGQGGGSRPGSAARSAARNKPETSSVTRDAEREIQISRKASDAASVNNNQQMITSPSPTYQNQIVPASSPMPSIQSPSPGRRKSMQGGRSTMGSTGNYSRSKPPRILEMLQSRHDELVQAIRGLAQRSDRRADSIEDRMNRMTSNAMMGLVLMCILLGGMCVGLLVSNGGGSTSR